MKFGNFTFIIISIALSFLLLSGIGEKNMDNIRLSLVVEKHEFIEGESIPFKVILENTGNQALTLHSFEPRNQSITLDATDDKNQEILGTQLSWKERNGVHIDAPRQYKTFEINPGEAETLSSDALEWLGTLPPGEYEMLAAYNSGVNIYAESEHINFKVIPAKPVYVKSVKSNIRLAYALQRSAWFNQTSNGYDLYLLESSPDFPPNIYRDWRVQQLTESFKVIPSAVNIDPPEATHLCWLDKKSELNIISISQNRTAGKLQKYSLNLNNAEILEPPYSDESGNLHVLISDQTGKEIIYALVSSDGKIEKNVLVTLPNGISHYSIMWDRDDVLYFVWAALNDLSIHYLTYKLNSKDKPSAAKILCKMTASIGNLELFQTNEPSGENYDEHLYVLTNDSRVGYWQRWIVDFKSPEPRIIDTLNGVNTVHFTIYKSALTVENEPVYIFKINSGYLYFYSSITQNLQLLLSKEGKNLTEDSQPDLLTTAAFSHKAGVYVRYLSKEKFEYIKIE